MRLAEALILRADLQKRLASLQQRLQENALVQEGSRPSEDPTRLLSEHQAGIEELEGLLRRINHTNTETTLEDGTTMTAALARRDVLKLRHSALRGLAGAAVPKQGAYSRSELRYQSTVDVAEIQRQADDVAREIRELDTRIQEANWRTELRPE